MTYFWDHCCLIHHLGAVHNELANQRHTLFLNKTSPGCTLYDRNYYSWAPLVTFSNEIIFSPIDNRFLCKSHSGVFISETHRKLRVLHLCSRHSSGCPLLVLFLHIACCCPGQSCSQYYHHLNINFAQGERKQGHAKGQLHEGSWLFLADVVWFHFRRVNRVHHRAQH